MKEFFNQQIKHYKRQMESGIIPKAYKRLMEYMMTQVSAVIIFIVKSGFDVKKFFETILYYIETSSYLHSVLLQALQNYQTTYHKEKQMVQQTIDFMQQYPITQSPHCFERTLHTGHITASAWITDFAVEYALFTHHKKIGKWLQLGGHCDGNINVQQVALQEAREESGLNDFKWKQNDIFDVDIHLIPKHKSIPMHYHYDIRFWLVADRNIPLTISNESKDLKWLSINAVQQYNNEASIMRMVEKCQKLAS